MDYGCMMYRKITARLMDYFPHDYEQMRINAYLCTVYVWMYI